MSLISRCSAFFSVFLLLSVGALAQDEDPDEKDAAAALAKAEALVSKGRHAKAITAYEKLAKRYPETRAGRRAWRRTAENGLIGWGEILRNGPSSNRVDIVVMGDCYTLKKQSTFDKASKGIERVFSQDPALEEYESYFNILRANVVSAEDGIDGYGRDASTALGARLLDNKTLPGQVAVDERSVRNCLAEMPEEDGFALVLVPRGTSGTGGRGLATIVGQPQAGGLIALSQAFVGLYDESDEDDGRSRAVPNERNIANTEDETRVPWAHFIEAKVSGIGVYKGGVGTLNGAWRPTPGACRMGGGQFLCAVCRELLILRMYEFVDPIDTFSPPLEDVLAGAGPHEFVVQAMRPKKHVLEARWWVLYEEDAKASVRLDLPSRTSRGPLPPITTDPEAESRRNKKGKHTFVFKPEKYDPGRYRVVCRVRDTTEVRGERWAWVLKDEGELLVSERSWVVVVK